MLNEIEKGQIKETPKEEPTPKPRWDQHVPGMEHFQDDLIDPIPTHGPSFGNLTRGIMSLLSKTGFRIGNEAKRWRQNSRG